MTAEQQAQLTAHLENYFCNLVRTQQAEPVHRVLELATILLAAGSYHDVREYFLTFLSELAGN
jgi:hypothetical protein